jgi:hypothetical protein
MAFVDVILELRRLRKEDLNDPRRVITGLSRFCETPAELVIELTEKGYVARGTKAEVGRQAKEGKGAKEAKEKLVCDLLPTEPPGLTVRELLARLPKQGGEAIMSDRRLRDILSDGAKEGKWKRTEAKGAKNDPSRYWRPKS